MDHAEKIKNFVKRKKEMVFRWDSQEPSPFIWGLISCPGRKVFIENIQLGLLCRLFCGFSAAFPEVTKKEG